MEVLASPISNRLRLHEKELTKEIESMTGVGFNEEIGEAAKLKNPFLTTAPKMKCKKILFIQDSICSNNLDFLSVCLLSCLRENIESIAIPILEENMEENIDEIFAKYINLIEYFVERFDLKPLTKIVIIPRTEPLVKLIVNEILSRSGRILKKFPSKSYY